ncbi:MAG: hypothetical protein JXA72_00035 [Bacteroidales bacterium]|nr:hypothetical protein [Bacteroidales bacterium]
MAFRILAFGMILILTSCSSVRKATSLMEEEHNALYIQKALIVYDEKRNRVMLTNPTCTRCYILKGNYYTGKWQPGDTMVINDHLEDFYQLRFAGKCKTPYGNAR